MSGKGFFQPTRRKADRKPSASQPSSSLSATKTKPTPSPAPPTSTRVPFFSVPALTTNPPYPAAPTSSATKPRPILRSKPVSADPRPSIRNDEWVPTGAFKSVLDLHKTPGANVVSSDAARFLRRLFYLMERRPQDADRLVSECQTIYETRYSRRRKSAPVYLEPPHEHNLSAPPPPIPPTSYPTQMPPHPPHVHNPSQVYPASNPLQGPPVSVPPEPAPVSVPHPAPPVSVPPPAAPVTVPPRVAPQAPTYQQPPSHVQPRKHSTVPKPPAETIDLTGAEYPTPYIRRPRGPPPPARASSTPVIDLDSITPVAADSGTNGQMNRNARAGPSRGPVLIKEDPPFPSNTNPDPPFPPQTKPQPVAPLPAIESGLLGDRGKVISSVKKRWSDYLAGFGRPRSRRTVDGSQYVVWDDGGEKVLLEVATCTNLVGLQDGEGALDEIHFEILRFLWLCLVKDRCAGAVLNHGVGYPRTHLTLVFCRLARKYGGDAARKIAVFCPPSTEKQWMYAQDACYSDHIHFAGKETWKDCIQKWNDDGGILVCSFDILLVIVKAPDSDAKLKAFEGLCRPGPDISIVDEAARLDECDEVLQRFLRKTRSKARLALTSSPFGGNLLRQWRIFNWAAPDLLGSMEEYWQVFIRHLIVDSNASSDVALQLSKMTAMVAFKLDLERRVHALRQKGRTLREATLVVDLDDEHRAVYRATASFVEKAISHGLSKFVALYLLLAAATSTHALMALLAKGCEEDQSTDIPEKMFRDVARARRHFLQLKLRIHNLVSPTNKSAKIALAVGMCQKWVTEKKRPAIFATIPEVERELHRELQDAFSESFYKYDLKARPQERHLQLEKFNTSGGGAVLLAPYGPVLDCVENGDWGFVNATHLLLIDGCWDPSALSQVVNRVHNFAVISDVVYVYHLIATDTVELNVQKRNSNIISGHQGSGRRLPVLPCITADMFKEPGPVSQQSRNHHDEELVVQLRALGAKASILTEPSRYTISSCLLEAGSDQTDLTMESNAEYFVAKERGAYLSTHSSLLKAIENSTRMSDRYKTWRDTGALKVKTLLFSPHKHKTNSLLSSWDDYFRLYEQDEVRKDLATELRKLEEAVTVDPDTKSEPRPLQIGSQSASRKRKREPETHGPNGNGFRHRHTGRRGPQY